MSMLSSSTPSVCFRLLSLVSLIGVLAILATSTSVPAAHAGSQLVLADTVPASTNVAKANTTPTATVCARSSNIYLPLMVNSRTTLASETQPASSNGTVRVRTVFDDGNGGVGEPVGAGVIVRANGCNVGTTDVNSILTFTSLPGDFTLQAVLPSLAIGSKQITVVSNQTEDVTIILDGNGEVIEPSTLVLDELVNGGLSFSTSTFTLRFVKDQVPVPVINLEEIELASTDPNFDATIITNRFSIANSGAITANDVPRLINLLRPLRSDAVLRVKAVDSLGLSYEETIVFAPGLFQVVGQLMPPPSQPALPVGSLTVLASFGNGIQKTITTDEEGRFTILQVPGGLLNLESATQYQSQMYSGVANLAVDGNKQLRVNMLGATDVLNGVPPWEILSSTLQEATLPVDQERGYDAVPTRLNKIAVTQADNTVQVNVSSAAENVPVSASAKLPVAKGSKKVILKYTVSTIEYPKYVLQQSRYNDTWRLTIITSSGTQLFTIGRSVNSQLYAPPTWNSSGSTGLIEQQIDVSTLAANNDIELTLAATSTNIGDSLLPTTVTATLGADAGLTINTITRDNVNPTVGQSNRFSIPRAGQLNTFQRRFDVTYTKPEGVTITNVKTELLTSGGAVLQTVVDEAPGSNRVQQINDTTLRIEVTFSTTPSQVNSTPPPTDQIRYRFTLKGQKEDGEELTSEPKDSAAFFALWRMPDGIARYGARDNGLDDWASQRTYQWLDANRNLVTRIDDISGEHARNIGHQTHAEGRDIDMFHVYTFPNGGASGTQNYLRLQANVQAALAGDAASAARVNAWATDTRARFDSLIADNRVQRIYYAVGSAVQGGQNQAQLTNGWAQALLQTGTYTAPNGITLALPAGAWGNANSAELQFNATHNNHFHVMLTP